MIKCTCCACGRVFEASELYVTLVRAGKAESICSYCEKTHDEEVPEVENPDEDLRQGGY